MTKAHGTTAWIFPTDGGIGLSSPAIANGVVYVGDGTGVIYAINAVTGLQLWSYQTGSAINFSPVVVNGMLFVGSFDKKLYAFGL